MHTFEKTYRGATCVFYFKSIFMGSLLIILLFVISLSGCSSRPSYPQAMQQAGRCMELRPDSALFYLSLLEGEIEEEPLEVRMYYYLLNIEAKDKLYIPHTSDSLINIVVDFYARYGNREKLMKAYYYQGSVYRDMNDAPRALTAFLQAIETGEETSLFDWLAKTYDQIRKLCAYQGLHDESLGANRKSMECYLNQDEIGSKSFLVRNLVRAYEAKKQTGSALHYYRKAYEFALGEGDSEKAHTILGELGCYYYELGNIEHAKEILLNVADKPRKMGNVLFRLSAIYKDLQQWDSAYYYFDEAMKFGDVRESCAAYRNLFSLEVERGNYPKAVSHITNYLVLKDSVDLITQTEAVARISSLYNYQHTETENIRLKLNAEKQKAIIYRLVLVLILLVLIAMTTFFFLKQRRKVALEKERKLNLIKEQQYAQSFAAIENNKSKLHELEQQLCVAEQQSNELQTQLIRARQELLETENHRIQAARNEQELLQSSLYESDIYLKFCKAGNDKSIKITDTDWQELQLFIDTAYPNFTNRLYSLHSPLSLVELRVCCLIKIAMPVKCIAALMNLSASAVSLNRSRLYEKIHGVKGAPKMFDEFISGL